MASAVDKQPAAARLSAVAAAGCLPTATRGSQSSYTTLWDTTQFRDRKLEQRVPERRRIEHIGVKQRRDRHPAAYSYPMPSAWLSSTSRSRAFSRSRLDRSS